MSPTATAMTADNSMGRKNDPFNRNDPCFVEPVLSVKMHDWPNLPIDASKLLPLAAPSIPVIGPVAKPALNATGINTLTAATWL